MDPALASVESGNRHRRVVELTRFVGMLCAFTLITELLLKPLPDNVMVREVVPAGTPLGETTFKTGTPDCRLNPGPVNSNAMKATIRMERVNPKRLLPQHY